MRSFCPLGKMSSIGRYPRNVLTYEQVREKSAHFLSFLRADNGLGSVLVSLWHRRHLSPGRLLRPQGGVEQGDNFLDLELQRFCRK